MTRRSASTAQVLWLTAVWVGLWGSLTVANLLGGLVLALLFVRLLPLSADGAPAVVRALPLLRFAAHFCVDLVVSSVQVAVLALRPRLQLRQAVLAVPVEGASDTLVTVLGNAISLTPGTLTLDVSRDSDSTLYVHVLDVGSGPDAVEDVRASIHRLAHSAVLAVGSPGARDALARDVRHSRPTGRRSRQEGAS